MKGSRWYTFLGRILGFFYCAFLYLYLNSQLFYGLSVENKQTERCIKITTTTLDLIQFIGRFTVWLCIVQIFKAEFNHCVSLEPGFLFRQRDIALEALKYTERCWDVFQVFCRVNTSHRDKTMTWRQLMWMLKVQVLVSTFRAPVLCELICILF